MKIIGISLKVILGVFFFHVPLMHGMHTVSKVITGARNYSSFSHDLHKIYAQSQKKIHQLLKHAIECKIKQDPVSFVDLQHNIKDVYLNLCAKEFALYKEPTRALEQVHAKALYMLDGEHAENIPLKMITHKMMPGINGISCPAGIGLRKFLPKDPALGIYVALHEGVHSRMGHSLQTLDFIVQLMLAYVKNYQKTTILGWDKQMWAQIALIGRQLTIKQEMEADFNAVKTLWHSEPKMLEEIVVRCQAGHFPGGEFHSNNIIGACKALQQYYQKKIQ